MNRSADQTGAESRGRSLVFIVGFPRSGTTLLQQILNRNSRIAIPPETHFMTRFWKRRSEIGRLDRDNVWFGLLEEITATPEFQESGLDPAELMSRGGEGPRSWARALRLVLETYADQQGAAVAGEKTPLHQVHMPRLQAWFPDATFLHMVRDPRAVVNSWRSVPWSSGSILLDAEEWKRRYEIALADAESIRRLMTVRYEDLVLRPEAVIRDVCEFIGVDFDPAMIRPDHSGLGVNVEREPWKAKAIEAIRADRIDAWKADLSLTQRLVIEVVTGVLMSEFGYSPSFRAGVRGASTPFVRGLARFMGMWHRRPVPWFSSGHARSKATVVVTDALVGSGNPYVELLADAIEAADPGFTMRPFRPRLVFLRRPPAIWHMQWPANRANQPSALRAVIDVGALAVAAMASRWRGIRMVWTVHNTEPHENRRQWLVDRLMRWLVPRLSGWISLSEAGIAPALQRYPRLGEVPRLVVRHGHYANRYPQPPDVVEARRKLGIGGEVLLLAVGTIRPYKRFPDLARAFGNTTDQRLRLIIGGNPADWPTVEALKAAAQDSRISLRIGRIPVDELALLFAAGDGFVLSAEDFLNSGSALLALSFGVPVMAPDTPVMRELQAEIGVDAVHLRHGPLSAVNIQRFATHLSNTDRGELAARVQNAHSWDSIGRQVADFYRALLSPQAEVEAR